MSWLLRVGLLLCGVYAASPFCLDGEKDLVDGTRCRDFIECEGGRWYLKQCQVGKRLNPRTGSCETAGALGCGHGKAKCEEGKTFSHPGSDSLYYKCQSGRVYIRYCGPGEVFDHKEGECRFIGSLAKSHGISGRSKRSAEVTCEEKIKRRDGKSCKNYLECINGEEVNKTCPDCMNFDEIHQSCRFNMVLPCGPNSNMPTLPPPTTPEPTTPAPPTPEPTKPAPPTPEPTKPAPPTAEPTKPEPPTAEPTKPAPPTAEPTKTEPTEPTPEPPKTEPTEPTPEPPKPEPTKPAAPTDAPKQ